MMRWLTLAVRAALVLAAVMCIATATATPLVGQQAADAAPQAAGASVSQTNSASTDLPGPRVRPDFPRVEPTFAGSNASGSAAAGSTTTITITTFALVLVVIILVLLIAD